VRQLRPQHPFAEAKLLAPSLRPGLVARPRVQRALDWREGVRLVLVAAPPGYGKTTAVRTWCASREGAVVWVTLDAGDNDPVRLWTYLATAVDRVRGGLGRGALQRLGVAGGPIEDPVIELMNALAAFDSEVTVVLDDFQAVTDRDCLESIDYAIEHLPAKARVIAMTRSDPMLRLAQLRARGELSEVRTSDLAFDADDAYELLVRRGGVELERREVDALCERTEGWPGALSLALLWLRAVDDPHRAVRAFGGDHRFVADYLNSEILGALDDDERLFLLRASVLGQFDAELCDAVFGRDDSVAMLARLEHSNLFVSRFEHGGLFRVHSLFAEFAGFQLAVLRPGMAVDIHRRAARWFHSRGLAVEAVEQAAAAGDHVLVAEILAEHHTHLIRTGAARTFLRWVRTLPDEQLAEHPELATAAASATALVGCGTIEKRRFLETAARARRGRSPRFTPHVDAEMGTVRAFTLDGGVHRAVLEGRRAVEIALASDDELVACLAGYAHALYFAGDPDEAWEAARRVIEHPDAERRPPSHAIARATLALIALESNHLSLARTHAEKARVLTGRIRSSRTWVGAVASAALGAVLATEGKPAEAEREFAHAERLFDDEVPTVHHAWILLLTAGIRCRRGRLDDGAAALAAAREELDALGDCGRLDALAGEVDRQLQQAVSRVADGSILETPSDAEFAVLRLLGSDLSVRGIGSALFISHNTVRTHTRAIYRKLGVNSRPEAVARATALGLLGANAS